jgi:hypothetical protein
VTPLLRFQRVQIGSTVQEYFEIVPGGQFDHLELEWRFGSSSGPPREDPFDGKDHSRSARRLAWVGNVGFSIVVVGVVVCCVRRLDPMVHGY